MKISIEIEEDLEEDAVLIRCRRVTCLLYTSDAADEL